MGACELLQSRKVTRLCHFTKVSSLTHILLNESGILASSSVNDKEFINDSERYDGNSDYVCCSIQYPNWWYYNKVEKQNKRKVLIGRIFSLYNCKSESILNKDIRYCNKDCYNSYNTKFFRL